MAGVAAVTNLFRQIAAKYGRQNFGKYVDDMLADDPGLRTALPAPTWRQVLGYVQFQLDSAILDVGDKAIFEINRTAIRDIQPTTQGGSAIFFRDSGKTPALNCGS